jgi:protein TonB
MRLITLCTAAFVCVIVPNKIQAQVKQPVKKTVQKEVNQKQEEEDYVFTRIEINAYTDRAKWDEHIRKGTMLPDSALKKIPSGTYPVLVQFIVDRKGNISHVTAEDDPGYGLGQKAVEIVKSYPGVWKPAIQCGNTVKSFKKQPVTFIVQ